MLNRKLIDAPSELPAPKHSWALFLDVDGTLADIVPTPDQAVVRPETVATLNRLSGLLGGALALVSGRTSASLDRLFDPHRFSLAGQHGLECRIGDGPVTLATGNHGLIHELCGAVSVFHQEHPRLYVEYKGLSIAVHYRQAPELEQEVKTFLRWHVNHHPRDLALIEGKMVCEIKLSSANKGAAVHAFMKQPPFAGRLPVFIGDDRTDEDGFSAVNALGGVSVKIGPGDTAAHHRLGSVAALAGWLDACAAALSSTPDAAKDSDT